MDEYRKLLCKYRRIMRRYKCMNYTDAGVDNLLDQIQDALSRLESLTISNQEEILELKVKIKILLSGTKLILDEK